MTLTTPEGVRLVGYYSRQPATASKGVVLVLHGWLGSANSNYALRIGDFLFRQGYSIFRLNFRDHGETYSLNEELFRGDLLDETVAAARQVAQLEHNRPMHVVGASMGGNFALRLAWQQGQAPIPNLGHSVAICPAIDGYHVTLALDRQPFYWTYFRRKWVKSLHQKMAAFPGKYDFSTVLAARSCLSMTEAWVPLCSPYPEARAYFDSYRVTPAMLADLPSPVSIIAAADDPIVPITDFSPFLQLPPPLRIYRQPYGGHVGFLTLFSRPFWLGEAILSLLAGGPGPGKK
jgi:hypothetical protein